MLRLSKKIILFLIISSLLRLLIVVYSLNFRDNPDVLRYKDWGRIAFLYGFEDTYNTDHLSFGTLPNNQPPGSLYILSAAYNAQIQTAKLIYKISKTKPGSNLWVNGPLLSFFLRIPSLIADLLLGVLIYNFIKKRANENMALLGSLFFLFNPAVIFNSAFWGQTDSLNNLAFFIAIYLLSSEKYFLSILTLCLSLFIKVSLLPLVPLFFLYIFLKRPQKIILTLAYILASLLFILVLTLPISKIPYLWLWQYTTNNSLGEMTNITNFSFNFWWLIFRPFISIGRPTTLFNFSEIRLVGSPFADKIFFGLPLSVYGELLFILFSLPLFYLLSKNSKQIKSFLLVLSLTALISFLFLPRIHERYLYPLFPLLATYIGLTRKSLYILIFLSLLNLINLYLVWHPVSLSFFPYTFMNNRNLQWLISCLTIVVFAFFYLQTLFNKSAVSTES